MLLVDAGSNAVGVGTSDFTAMGSSSYAGLKVGGSVLQDSGGGNGSATFWGNNAYVGGSNNFYHDGGGKCSGIQMTSGDINFLTFDGGGGSADAQWSPTARMVINDDGVVETSGDFKPGADVIMASGRGISFTADGNATGMTSELLDDYEEGTWTPSLSGASSHPTNSFNSRGGFYTKIGDRVFWSMRFSMAGSGITPGSGTLSVDGLPFTVKNDESMQGGIAIGHSANWLTGQHGAPTGGFYNTNSTTFPLVVYDNDGGNIAGMSYADAADVDESTTLTASGHFIV